MRADFKEGPAVRVLVIDDQAAIRSLLERALGPSGFEVVLAASAEDALAAVEGDSFDLYVVDQMLPGMSGLALVKELRRRGQRGILMLTAKDAIADRVLGLEAGADDYLGKPFAIEELTARLHALARRSGDESAATLVYEDLVFDPATMQARRGSRLLDLSPTERNLLAFFLRHPRQALSRAQILQAVWSYDFGGEDNVLEVYVGYLRRKTEQGGEERLIQTVRGYGYALRRP